MMKPHQITIDCDANAGYIKYASGSVIRTVDVWKDGQVAVDYDADDHIVGIEVLGFDESTLEQARQFAEKNALAFPPNLRGSLVAAG